MIGPCAHAEADVIFHVPHVYWCSRCGAMRTLGGAWMQPIGPLPVDLDAWRTACDLAAGLGAPLGSDLAPLRAFVVRAYALERALGELSDGVRSRCLPAELERLLEEWFRYASSRADVREEAAAALELWEKHRVFVTPPRRGEKG